MTLSPQATRSNELSFFGADPGPSQMPLTERNFTTLNEELQMLRSVGVRKHFTRNQTLFVERSPATHAYKVIDGFVRLYRILPDRSRQIADFMVAGDVFGFAETT